MYLVKSLTLHLYLLGSNKERKNNTQKLINKGIRWIAGLQKAKFFLLRYILFLKI